MVNTQLMCTFTRLDKLESTIEQLIKLYKIEFDTIYVLENVNVPDAMCCTFNIASGTPLHTGLTETTISLHRKKATNTLYTINAINAIIASLNGGVVDSTFQIPWKEFKNSILVTAYGSLKKIDTKLHNIIKISSL